MFCHNGKLIALICEIFEHSFLKVIFRKFTFESLFIGSSKTCRNRHYTYMGVLCVYIRATSILV